MAEMMTPEEQQAMAALYGLGAPIAPGDPYAMQAAQVQAPPQLSTQFDPQFEQYFGGMAGAMADTAGRQYDYEVPQAQAAQLDLSALPFLQPDILAKMHAGAIEGPAESGIQELAAAKRALGDSGMSGSPERMAAVSSDIARRTGQSQMQMSNQLALEAANKLFAAMQQNTQNQQAVNMANAGAQQQQQAAKAGAKSGIYESQGNMWQNAALGMKEQNERTNVQNTIDWQNANANREMNAAGANFNELNSRYAGARNALLNPQVIQ